MCINGNGQSHQGGRNLLVGETASPIRVCKTRTTERRPWNLRTLEHGVQTSTNVSPINFNLTSSNTQSHPLSLLECNHEA